MNVFYLPHYSGPLFCSSFETLKIALSIHGKYDYYFYVWDLEWLRLGGNFESYSDIRNPNVKLVARSKSHAEVIENFSNRKVSYIVDDWNINQIKEIINE